MLGDPSCETLKYKEYVALLVLCKESEKEGIDSPATCHEACPQQKHRMQWVLH